MKTYLSSLVALPLLLLAAALPCRAERPRESIGLYPIALPSGHEGVGARLAAELHDGASALPGVRAFELIPKGACEPDEGGCLADAARSAKVDAVVSAQVSSTETGYRYQVRAFAVRGGELRGEEQGEVVGGPLDLGGALEHGVCTALGAAPCNGSLWVGLVPGEGIDGNVVVDGVDRGSLPLARPLSLPVGRHLVQAGGAERRVRISYGREARLLSTSRGGQPSLLAEGESAVPAQSVLAEEAAPAAGTALPRTLIARILLGSGAALLATGAGLQLYSAAHGSAQPASPAGPDRLGPSRGAASTAALLLAATGIGTLAVGGILVAATPGGLSAVGRF
jgi:hypothetical protein